MARCRSRLVPMVVLGAVLAGAGPAAAATVSLDAGRVTFTAGAGIENNLTISLEAGVLVVSDAGDPITPTGSCA